MVLSLILKDGTSQAAWSALCGPEAPWYFRGPALVKWRLTGLSQRIWTRGAERAPER